MKQETLEEFINQSNTPEGLDQFSYDKGLEEGAKWQAERMYSEEDMRTAISIAYSKGLAKPNSGRLSDIPNVQNDILQQLKKE